MVADEPNIINLEKQLITIMKRTLDKLREDYRKQTGDNFPIITPDLTEMSTSEFECSLRNLPANFSSDYIYDLRQLRGMLAGFGHYCRSRVLRLTDFFKKGIKSNFYKYKGF